MIIEHFPVHITIREVLDIQENPGERVHLEILEYL